MLGRRYAFDFVRTDASARGMRFYRSSLLRYAVLGVPLTACYGWGQPIFASACGTVVDCGDGWQERDPVHLVKDLAVLLKNGLTFNIRRPDLRSAIGNYIILETQDNRGARIGQPAARTLSPGQAFREDVLSLFRVVVPAVFPPPMLDGYIRIRSVDGRVFQAAGDINITSGDNVAAMLYPILPASPAAATMPFVINDAAYFTGYAIANPNEMLTLQTDLTIELGDRDGRLVGSPRSVSLSPGARFVSLVARLRREPLQRVREVLNAVGLAGLEDRSIRELSMGQRRRAVLGAAWIGLSHVILLDEPLETLDRAIREEVLAWIDRMLAHGSAVVVSTHEIEPFMFRAARALAIRAGQCLLVDPLPAPEAARLSLLESMARTK